MASTKIAELAAQIQENTAKVDRYLQSRELPSPSFHEDGPVDFNIEDEKVQEAREIALDSSLELHQLLLGPALCLRPVVSTHIHIRIRIICAENVTTLADRVFLYCS